MIPIHKNSLQLINVNVLPSDDTATIAYKNLLKNQLLWCNSGENAAVIMKQAKNLYKLITEQRAWPQLKNRCCNFTIDEKQYHIYCQKHNFVI